MLKFEESQIEPGGRRRRIAIEQLFEYRSRLVTASQTCVDDREIVQDVGVVVAAASSAFERLRGSAQITGSAQRAAEPGQELGRVALRFEPGAEQVDCL